MQGPNDCVDATREQRFTFDEVAELYDLVRPRYPHELFLDLIRLAHLKADDRVLEIGCGTGQATEPLARRGYSLLCLEPGPSMARVARERLARFTNVEVVTDSFEHWSLQPESFALVMSAQAFHWVAPEIRFQKAAAALHPGGHLAIFGATPLREATALRRALDRAYTAYAPAMASSPTSAQWYSASSATESFFAASGSFGAVTKRSYHWSRVYKTADYLDLMRTQSDHRLLPETQRETLLAEIGKIIEACGGSITTRYEAHLFVAPALSKTRRARRQR
jgi:SAM-dependent methyltransferase